MTQRVNLPNGQQGIIGSPAHRLLQHMAATVTGYAACGTGGICTTTQLRSLAKANHVKLHHAYEGARAIVVGAYLTPAGERYVEMLNEAEAAAERLNELIGV
ncbi:MAG: hypothetical protein ABW046_22460 [Actinoplanes sp.]